RSNDLQKSALTGPKRPKVETEDGCLCLGQVADSGGCGALIIFRSNAREVFAGDCCDRPVRVNKNERPTMPQKIAAHFASDFDKIVHIAAVSELSTGNEPLDEARHEHKGPSSTVCRAADDDAAVGRLHLQQSPLALLKIRFVEAIYCHNGRAQTLPAP